jgi:hypothetical protein
LPYRIGGNPVEFHCPAQGAFALLHCDGFRSPPEAAGRHGNRIE